MSPTQHVCTVCGYNLLGDRPERCPFCGAGRDEFLTAEAASARHRLVEHPLTDRLSRLDTEPAIGIEHAAYRLDTGRRIFLIDCPATFDPGLRPVEVIVLTHLHFLGASNLYRDALGAEVWIHAADARDPLARPYPFDRTFERGFAEAGLEVLPIGGHTPGFTVYRHADTLFPGDLVCPEDGGLSFNGHGPARPTRNAAARLWAWLEGRPLARVCGWNYVAEYGAWRERFRHLLASHGLL